MERQQRKEEECYYVAILPTGEKQEGIAQLDRETGCVTLPENVVAVARVFHGKSRIRVSAQVDGQFVLLVEPSRFLPASRSGGWFLSDAESKRRNYARERKLSWVRLAQKHAAAGRVGEADECAYEAGRYGGDTPQEFDGYESLTTQFRAGVDDAVTDGDPMSNYQEFTNLPAFEQSIVHEGKRMQSASDNPTWSNTDQPPKLGDIVDVRINGIGLAKVVGYFVEENFLGLLVKPFDPPAWYIKQNGYNATGHVFGAEIYTGDFAAPVLNGPSQEQLAALQRYANSNGRYWKRSLSSAWSSGADERESDAAFLRQVRNQFGPSWLNSRRNPICPK